MTLDVSEILRLSRDQVREMSSAVSLEVKNLVGGTYRNTLTGKSLKRCSPVLPGIEYSVPDSEEEDVALAVQSCRDAFKARVWSGLEPRQKMNILYRFADLIESHAMKLALYDVTDVGKPIYDVLTVDIPQALLILRYFAEAIDKEHGYVTETASTDLNLVTREPLGVIGALVPWNYPLLNAVYKIAPALAAGNCIVLKPSELSPRSAGLLGELFLEAGGPPGVFNIVHGSGDGAGRSIALSMDVDMLSFTGSTRVGKLLHIYSGQSNLKRVFTECGGKTPQIIARNCKDLKAAVVACVDGIYANQGQVCSAGSRLLVARELCDEFVSLFKAISQDRYRPGDPLDPATRMGSLVSIEHKRQVTGMVRQAIRGGARLVMPTALPEPDEEDCYCGPILLSGVAWDSEIAQHEVFGPVAVAIPFDTLDEAIEIANATVYGLAASIWTEDLSEAIKSARKLQAGVVWINCFDRADMTQPWGGYKQSGNGRDKCLETLQQFTQSKSTWIHLG